MSEKGDEEGGKTSLPTCLDDSEACKELNHEELAARVRKINEDLEATLIPLHDVPVALVVERITREKMAASWYRLCQDGGRSSDGRHILQAVRSTVSPDSHGGPNRRAFARGRNREEEQQRQQRRSLTWEDEYPRSRYRGDFFKPPRFDDEPSGSDDDDEAPRA